IPIDCLPTKELVEFWSHKYSEVKRELEQLEGQLYALPLARPNALEERLEDVAAAFQQESRWRQEGEAKIRGFMTHLAKNDQLNERLLTLEKVNQDLRRRLSIFENERSLLWKQITMFWDQAVALAVEAHRQRNSAVTDLFGPAKDIAPRFMDTPLSFSSSPSVMNCLPEGSVSRCELRSPSWYFLPSPPRSLPLRVSKPGQNGYWFYPIFKVSGHSEFQLIVETKPNSWRYMGTDVTVPLTGYEMKLSEWAMLDDKTRDTHCERVLSDLAASTHGPILAMSQDIRSWYNTGELTVPCYGLQCISFNVVVYNMLHEPVKGSQRSGEGSSMPSGASAVARVESETHPRPAGQTECIPDFNGCSTS
ncbi:hypothetical protein OBBRIDRAFT_876835, partial [Obba rivulosa]